MVTVSSSYRQSFRTTMMQEDDHSLQRVEHALENIIDSYECVMIIWMEMVMFADRRQKDLEVEVTNARHSNIKLDFL